MAYKPTNPLLAELAQMQSSPATLATLATVHQSKTQSVANVATVAGPTCVPRISNVATVASVQPDPTQWDDRRVAYEERAAILEYDGGFSRAEAERLSFAEVYGQFGPDDDVDALLQITLQ